MSKEKALFSWSGGKDSALCLYQVLQGNDFEITALLTVLNGNHKRVSMHGVREEMLDRQADSIGIPLVKMYVKEGSNEEYERNMEKVLLDFKARGVNKVIFGDIFLEDLRQYRDKNLARVGMEGVYPLWMKDTNSLVQDFLQLGFNTIVCCVNDAYLSQEHCGQVLDEAFIRHLPQEVDPCGENGEYHTFTFSGPLFRDIVEFTAGEKVYKPLEVKHTVDDDHPAIPGSRQTKGFWFLDLLPI